MPSCVHSSDMYFHICAMQVSSSLVIKLWAKAGFVITRGNTCQGVLIERQCHRVLSERQRHHAGIALL